MTTGHHHRPDPHADGPAARQRAGLAVEGRGDRGHGAIRRRGTTAGRHRLAMRPRAAVKRDRVPWSGGTAWRMRSDRTEGFDVSGSGRNAP